MTDDIDSNDNHLKEELLRAYQEDDCYFFLINNFANNLDNLAQPLLDLVNQKKIDLNLIMSKIPNVNDDFFKFSAIIEDIIPKLSIPTKELLRIVSDLYNMASPDSNAVLTLQSFERYLKSNPEKNNEIFGCVMEDISEYYSLLPSIIKSRSDHEKLMIESIKALSSREVEDVRLFSICSLSEINWGNQANQAKEWVEWINSCLDKENAINVCSAYVFLLVQLFNANFETREDVFNLLEKTLKKNPEGTMLNLTRSFALQGNLFDDELFEKMVSLLSGTTYSHPKITEYVDMGMRIRIENNGLEKSLDDIEYLLVNCGNLRLSKLSGVIHGIINKPELVSGIVTRWLNSPEMRINLAASDLVDYINQIKSMKIEFDHSLCPQTSPEDEIRILKKAIGFFFSHPTIVLDFCISPICNNEIVNVDEVIDCLYDPFAISYPEICSDYLSKNPNTKLDKLKQMVTELNHNEIKHINEFSVDPEKKYLGRIAYAENFREISNEAMRSSVFLNLVSKSTLLFGNRSISFYKPDQGEEERMDVKLQKHTFSVDIARGSVCSPITLAYDLFILRTGG